MSRATILCLLVAVSCSKLDTRSNQLRVVLTTGTCLEFAWVPPSTKSMGSKTNEMRKGTGEGARLVSVSNGYWLGRTETTQKVWKEVMGRSMVGGRDDLVPAAYIEDVSGFMERLPSLVRKVEIDGRQVNVTVRFRLPSEIEWEWACRAGTSNMFYWGDNKEVIGEYGWVRCNSGGRTHRVGLKKPNAYGLYDMIGNVAEVCSDEYTTSSGRVMEKSCDGREVSDRPKEMVIRGGDFASEWTECQSTARASTIDDCMRENVGFRLVAEALR